VSALPVDATATVVEFLVQLPPWRTHERAAFEPEKAELMAARGIVRIISRNTPVIDPVLQPIERARRALGVTE